LTREEFERRMRVLEGEIDGEKAVTRYVLEQARLNGDDLASMKAQLSHLADDMVVVKATLNSHGTRLNLLTQDVSMIRQEVTALRGDMATLRGEMTTLHGDVRTLHGDVTTLRGDVTTLQRDIAMVRSDVAAIRAAVVPSNPSAG
jgi:chromosome segregation ATPase